LLIALPLLCHATLLAAWPAGALAMGAATAPRTSVVLAFAPVGEAELASVKGLSVGLMSATQGRYTAEQLLLDISQGARVASSAYAQARPPQLSLVAVSAGGTIAGWQAARRRAEDAPQLLQPGLLAGRIPGGGAYAGTAGTDDIDAVAAADRQGHLAAVSVGDAATLLRRVAGLRNSERFVVCDLPRGAEGQADLRALGERRPAGELLLVVQRAPDTPGHELLWAAAGGLKGDGSKELSSHTTNQRGLIAAVDLAPTILGYLGLRAIPAAMRGDPIETSGPLHSASLRTLRMRLEVIGPRRLKALGCLLGAWALLLLGAAWWPRRGAGRKAQRRRAPGSRARVRAWTMRAGALGVLWAPVTALIPAALQPSAAVEYATITLACLALGALTDALLPWPRAPLAPAIAAIVALLADALAGTQLLMRSLLGPDPVLGARFYGFGNELKSGLAVLVLAAVAAALYPAVRGPRAALALAITGALLAAIIGSARIGAGVGGVILVSAGFAVATAMLLPGGVTRRRALLVLISPVAALVALAALDLATARGSGHYTGSILHARSAGDLRGVIVRRYTAAWEELKNHAMPAATAVALAYAALGLRRRLRLLAPVASDPAWLAAFAGGLAVGVVGALSEDSGPVLLVVAVFALGCVATYLWGRPLRPTADYRAADGDRDASSLNTARRPGTWASSSTT
jgi:hypothetical protein